MRPGIHWPFTNLPVSASSEAGNLRSRRIRREGDLDIETGDKVFVGAGGDDNGIAQRRHLRGIPPVPPEFNIHNVISQRDVLRRLLGVEPGGANRAFGLGVQNQRRHLREQRISPGERQIFERNWRLRIAAGPALAQACRMVDAERRVTDRRVLSDAVKGVGRAARVAGRLRHKQRIVGAVELAGPVAEVRQMNIRRVDVNRGRARLPDVNHQRLRAAGRIIARSLVLGLDEPCV